MSYEILPQDTEELKKPVYTTVNVQDTWKVRPVLCVCLLCVRVLS